MGDYLESNYIEVVAQVVSYNGGNFVNQFIDNTKNSFLNELTIDRLRETSLNPIRKGYTFAGFVDSKGNILFEYDRTNMKNVNNYEDIVDGEVYTAIWYDLENPTIDEINITNTITSEQILTMATSDTGSGIKGYYVGKENPNEVNVDFTNNSSYTINSDGVWYIATIDNEDNLTCVSKTFKYVYFDGNKGNSSNDAIVSCDKKLICIDDYSTYGELQGATKEGYEFLGWDYNGTIVNSDSAYNKEEQTLKAKWKLIYDIVGEDVVYDGLEHSKEIKTNDNNVLIEYKFGDGEYSKEVPKFIDAGDYIVNYRLSIDDIVIEDSYTISIAKADSVAITEPMGKDLSLNGQNQDLYTLGTTNDGIIYYRVNNGNWSTSNIQASEANNYLVEWYIKGDKNHNDSKIKSFTSTIKYNVLENVSATGYSGSYDGNSHSGIVSCSTEGVTIEYKIGDNGTWSTSNPTITTCGSMDVYYRITKEYYTPIEGKFTISVTHNYNAKTVNNNYLKSSATCTAKAVYYYSCSGCGAKGTTTYENGSALGHNYSSSVNGTLRSNATCTSPATYYNRCTRCSAQNSSYHNYGSALGHSATTGGALRSSATCTASATYWHKCSRCNAQLGTYYSSGSALGHNAYAQLVSNATCTSAAIYHNYCSRCSASLSNNYYSGSALGHSAYAQLISNATCTSAAIYHNYCSRCSASLSDNYYSGSALGHNISCVQSRFCNKYLTGCSTHVPGARGQVCVHNILWCSRCNTGWNVYYCYAVNEGTCSGNYEDWHDARQFASLNDCIYYYNDSNSHAHWN